MPHFPDYFPDNAELLIKNAGGEYISQQNVYRILRNGELIHDAFLSSYAESGRARRPGKPTIGDYSTSFSDTIERLRDLLNTTMRGRCPNPAIAKGNIVPCFGPSTLPDRTHHIHWWIFEDATPETYFRKEE